jgi:hypothetical protein
MYSFEDTGANYCLICGVKPYNIYKTYYFYNTVLPGKVIYNHTINWSNYNAVNSVNINDTNLYDSIVNNYTYGYLVQNIEDIDNGVGIQNVFSIKLASVHRVVRMAAVLITS